MTFKEWQQRSPAESAHEIHARVQALAPGQQRAVLAALASETDLASALSHLGPNAAGASAGAGPLHGLPYLAKDLFPVAGESMRAGSTFLPEVRPPEARDSALIARLRACGAVLAGRTHLHEFAYGITGENPHYGDVEHPQFPGRTSGGSSSGSAAAVAAGVVPLALGTDTGGSIRLPAAFCGVYGFRLTPGDPYIADAFPLAPSFDTAGWFTAHASDMLAALSAIIGLPSGSGRNARGGYLALTGLDDDVGAAFVRAAARYCEPCPPDVAAPLTTAFRESASAYNIVVADEAWAVHRGWTERFRECYDPAVWQRLERVHSLTSDARESARRSVAAIRRAWSEYFSEYDFLILPASPFPALTKADCTLANRTRILELTAPASIGGWPVLTVPVPLASGLTTGLQIVVQTPTSAHLREFLA